MGEGIERVLYGLLAIFILALLMAPGILLYIKDRKAKKKGTYKPLPSIKECIVGFWRFKRNAKSVSVKEGETESWQANEISDNLQVNEVETTYPVYQHTKEQEERYAEYKRKEEKRNAQIETFVKEDMLQFQDIPFLWNKDLWHSNNKAWMQLSWKDAESALDYIDQVSRIVSDTCKAIDFFMPQIRMDEIDFDYPVPFFQNSLPNTYLECTPYTPTGKISKYPAVLHFASSRIERVGNHKYQSRPYMGVIKIMVDGQIGSASVLFADHHTEFSLSLFGLSLVVKRIDSDMGCIFKFEDLKN